MKTTKLLLSIAALSAVLASSTALAGAISGIVNVTFSGPGGTGSEGLAAGWPSGLTEPVLDYTTLDYIDVAITVAGPGTYLINEAPGFGAVRNHTGQAWTNFDLKVQAGSVGSFSLDWLDGGSNFSSISQSATDIFFSGGSVPNNSSAFQPFGHFTTPGAGTFTVREKPSAAPEPTSLALIGLGVCGAGLVRRRVR